MTFNGFPSVSAFESECARLGFTTERQTYHKDGDAYTLLIVGLAAPTPTSVITWHLFTEDESAEVLTGIAPASGDYAARCAAQLAEHGFIPDEAEQGHSAQPEAPSVPEIAFAERDMGGITQYALFA